MSRYCPSSSLGGIEEGVEEEDEVLVQQDEATSKQGRAVQEDIATVQMSQLQLTDGDCDGLITDCALGAADMTCSQSTETCDNGHIAVNSIQSSSRRQHKLPAGFDPAISLDPLRKRCAHVVFVIDISASMRKRDVLVDGQLETRLSAVIACVADFLNGQVGSFGSRSDLFSLVTFNDKGCSQFTCRRLASAQKTVGNLMYHLQPCLGTCYRAGLEQALAACTNAAHLKESAVGQHVIIFLSDGRPADMNNGLAMGVLEEIKQLLGDKLQLHTVGFGREQLWWLDLMASSAYGRFHDHSLPSGHCGVLSSRALRETFRDISSSLTASRSIMSSALGPSSSTLLPKHVMLEPPAQYLYGGATVAGVRGAAASLQNVEVYMHLGGSSRLTHTTSVQLRLRPFAEGAQRLAYHMFDSSRPVGQQHLVAKPSHFMELEHNLGRLEPALKCVAIAKDYAGRSNAALATASRSTPLLDLQVPLRLLSGLTHISILDSLVYRFERESLQGIPFAPGSTHVYVPAEPFLRGHYIKYNGNNGHVAIVPGKTRKANQQLHGSITGLHHQLAHAFSHYTYHASGGSLLVCDIQGVGTTYTDPQVNSKDKAYGRSDMGQDGINKFFLTHKCNAVCSCLGITLGASAWGVHRRP